MMNKADIKNGIVANIIVVDPDHIPDWCANWPNAVEGCQIGGSYADGVFTPLPVAPPTAEQIRTTRDSILVRVVDPLVCNPLRWADLTAETQAAWAAYRLALLDVPQQAGFPTDIIWPSRPD